MVMKPNFNKITLIPVREQVAAELRNVIFSGSLPPGTELRQDDIAQKLGVSRMPVREAFQILAQEGLIEYRKNRSVIISDVPQNYIREHFEVRIILECEAVLRCCARIHNLDELKRIHELQKQAIEKEDIKQVNLCNLSFHKHIWDNAGNRKLASILENLWNGLSIGTVVVPAVHVHKSFEEHGLIIEAFAHRMPEQAVEIMRRHITRSMENMLLRPTKK
ncbi:MAG: GntR family transcriptional regulator [Spirochaetes bacterium]|nr:GntR family transcriptional regulator [Spirochaetota bacterium]